MCGITGFATNREDISFERNIQAMAHCLEHRGPDSHGVFVDQELGIALGHRRLAILDLSETGLQPMSTTDDRYTLIYNGEIYNHRDIRKKLGYSGWNGSSDTETVLQAFREWGINRALNSLNGMFALALLDKKKQQLVLARDRMGIKPLFFGQQSDTFVFGSELKSFISSELWVSEVDKQAFLKYMRLGYVPAPHCILKDVYKLPAAGYLIFDIPSFQIKEQEKYWDIDRLVQQGMERSGDHTEAEKKLDRLEYLFSDSVQKRMLSDVPLGSFLSGGIDSSLITAMMQVHTEDSVSTFSIGFRDAEYDESRYAEQVASYLGTNHTTKMLDKQDCLDIIQDLPAMYDEPFADSSQIPTHLVSRVASENVKVILSGDGADELFAGYNRHFMGHTIWNKIRRIPHPLRNMAGAVNSMLSADIEAKLVNILYPKSQKIPHLSTKIEKLNRVIQARSYEDLYAELAVTSPEFNRLVAGEGINSGNTNDGWLSFTEAGAYFSYMDMVRALPDDMLVKVDRASMACSLEVRVPFLDHRLVEYAWQLPFDQKIRNGEGKWILKQLAYRHIPKKMLDRPKKGFEVPVAEWLRGDLREWASNLLFETSSSVDHLLNKKVLDQIWTDHVEEKWNHKDLIWAILMYKSWEQEYGVEIS